MIKIDGVTYNIPIVSMKRSADFLDNYAKRNEAGDLLRKLIGVYFNYDLKLGRSTTVGLTAYQALWDKLSEPVEYHTVSVPAEDGEYVFTAYFASVSDELLKEQAEKAYFKNLTVSFIAKSPARRPRS